MSQQANSKSMIVVAVLLSAVFLSGCSIREKKDPLTGHDKDVDISTPFGSLSVKEGGVNVKDTGLPGYPGAHPATERGEKENANVNISSSLFGLKVVVQRYETDDPPDKVLSFYEKPMGKYGPVLQCKGGGFHGFHKHEKDDPVTCDDSGHEYMQQLKAGTQNNQHVVAVKSRGNGSEFVLVYVRAWDSNDTI